MVFLYVPATIFLSTKKNGARKKWIISVALAVGLLGILPGLDHQLTDGIIAGVGGIGAGCVPDVHEANRK
jgi:hypothetical protein